MFRKDKIHELLFVALMVFFFEEFSFVFMSLPKFELKKIFEKNFKLKYCLYIVLLSFRSEALPF